MKFARRERNEVEINITPLIDVVFLLLIFMLVSTTFTKQTQFMIDLPEASGEPRVSNETQIEISITKDGGYAVNESPLAASDLATLMSAIEEVSSGDTTLPMIITADYKTSHQAVVTAMDAAGQVGFVHLSITTRQRDVTRN